MKRFWFVLTILIWVPTVLVWCIYAILMRIFCIASYRYEKFEVVKWYFLGIKGETSSRSLGLNNE